MTPRFPATEFFLELARRAGADARLRRLGAFDATFGVRVLPGGAVERPRLVVLGFETGEAVTVREAPPGDAPDDADFVIEAPYGIWREMLASRGPDGAIDAAHTLNTLTHYDDPMRVDARDPLAQDKLFRFQESVQCVFDLAAALEAEAGG